MNSASAKNRRTAQSCSVFLTRIDAVPVAELGNQTGSILSPEMILQAPAFLRILAGQNRSRQKRAATKQAQIYFLMTPALIPPLLQGFEPWLELNCTS
jgi:hypothetical protein